jgi:hypothetical protein
MVKNVLKSYGQVQWGFENQTSPDFEWSISAGTGHSITGHSKTGHICPVFEWATSLDRFIKKIVIKKYFIHAKTV